MVCGRCNQQKLKYMDARRKNQNFMLILPQAAGVERDSAQRRTFEAAELIEAMEALLPADASTDGGGQPKAPKPLGLELLLLRLV